MVLTDTMRPVGAVHDHQIRIGDLWFGQRDADGVAWWLADVPSFLSLSLRAETGSRAWNDGGWVGSQWLEAAHFEIHLILISEETTGNAAGSLLQSRLDAIMRGLPLRRTVPVLVKQWDRWLLVEARCEESVKVIPVSPRRWDVTIPMVAPNPVKYAADPNEGAIAWDVYETALPKKSGGLRVPFRVPFIIRSSFVAGELRFTVGGSARPLSQIIITGPVKNPVIRDAVAGWRVAVNLDMSAGERLVIDPGARTVELNGASRRGAISGGFPAIDVGEHLITWSADAFSQDARLKIRVAESYL